MTRDEVISLARDVFDVETDSRGRETFSGDSYGIERFAALVAAREREACAKLLEDTAYTGGMITCESAAAAIRARSKE